MEMILIFLISVRTLMPDAKPDRVQMNKNLSLFDLMGLGDPFPGIPSHLNQFTVFSPPFLVPCIPPSLCMDHIYGMLSHQIFLD